MYFFLLNTFTSNLPSDRMSIWVENSYTVVVIDLILIIVQYTAFKVHIVFITGGPHVSHH